MGEVIQSPVMTIALAGSIDQGQPTGVAYALGIAGLTVQEPLLQGQCQIFRKADTDKSPRRQGIAIANESDRVLSADDLTAQAQRHGYRESDLGHCEARGLT